VTVALRREGALDVRRLLEAVEDAPPVSAIDAIGDLLREMMGASEVALLLADFSGEALIRLGHSGAPLAARTQGRETAELVPLAGTPDGRALALQVTQVEEDSGAWRVFAPVTNRGEAIGVLELVLADEPGEQLVADAALAAHTLAYVVIANRRFTDLFEWGQRSVRLSLAAEVQHRLLPGAYSCEAGQFTLAAWLEPSGDIAGDTFDFSLDRDFLHLSITDAMGHALQAAVLATILVGALRNARRAGVGLTEQARRASAGLAEYVKRSEFVTGQLARIDLRAGTATVVNAGHPPPLRLRNGRVEVVELDVDLPFAILDEPDYHEQDLQLVPGDRLMFVTDGMLERNAAKIDISDLILEGAAMHSREAVQHLIRAVRGACGGELQDDATVLCLDWHGGPPRSRISDGGADGALDPEDVL
jgi:serine phosphatase RsbU (regulator of sigma subunit)